MKTVSVLVIAGLVCISVAVREWNYRSAHPFALGPSGYIVALGVAGALAAFVTALWVYRRDEHDRNEKHAVWTRLFALQKQLNELTLDELELRRLEHELDVASKLAGSSDGSMQ
jgi:hypothetical protein